VISFYLSILFIYYINIMDTSDFRRPRPDFPILPSRAIFRSDPLKPFKAPKGRKGRKPKGRPLRAIKQARAFADIKQADEKRKSRELAIKERESKERLEIENLQIKREQLRLTNKAQEDTERFRSAQVARETQAQLNQQSLEFRRQRELRQLYQAFAEQYYQAERRQGETQAQFAKLIADSNKQGHQISRDDFIKLQQQVEQLTPRGGLRPSPQAERAEETTDITFRSEGGSFQTAGGASVIRPEDASTAFGLSPVKAEQRAEFLAGEAGGGSVRAQQLEAELAKAEEASPEATETTLDEIAGLTPKPSPPPTKQIAKALSERAEFLQEAILKRTEEAKKLTEPKPEPQPEPAPAGETPRQKLIRTQSEAREKAQRALGLGAKAKKPTPQETAGFLLGGVEEPEPIATQSSYQELVDLRDSFTKGTDLSDKPRGAKFGTFKKGMTRYVISGEIKKGKTGNFAVHRIDPKKKGTGTFVYRDVSVPIAEGSAGGFGSTTFANLEKLADAGKVVFQKEVIEEEEAQP
jgi:hypothetical protein